MRPTSTEPGLDTSALHASAVRLARTLAWIPGERESRDFGERCQKLTSSFRSLLAGLEGPADTTASADFQAVHENTVLLRGELELACATFSLPIRFRR